MDLNPESPAEAGVREGRVLEGVTFAMQSPCVSASLKASFGGVGRVWQKAAHDLKGDWEGSWLKMSDNLGVRFRIEGLSGIPIFGTFVSKFPGSSLFLHSASATEGRRITVLLLEPDAMVSSEADSSARFVFEDATPFFSIEFGTGTGAGGTSSLSASVSATAMAMGAKEVLGVSPSRSSGIKGEETMLVFMSMFTDSVGIGTGTGLRSMLACLKLGFSVEA
jgi:hypothetical protein